MNARFQPPKRAFTLIEILTVLAIISLLAAFLFPAFAQVREKSRQTVCLSNMREIGIALTLYQHDFDGRLPVATETGPTQSGVYIWHTEDEQIRQALKTAPTVREAINPYVKNDALWHCPSDVGGQQNLYRAALQGDDVSVNAPDSFYQTLGNSYVFRTEAGFVDTLDQAKAEDFGKNALSLAQIVLAADKTGCHMIHHTNPVQNYLLPSDGSGGVRSGLRNTLFADGHVKSLADKDFGLLWLGNLGVR